MDALILSHAHIDHSGNIPSLIRSGFRGDIYATSATRDLCAATLPDSAHIQEQDVAYVNKKRARKGLPPVEALYSKEDANESLKYFVGAGYGRTFDVVPGVRATFRDAGHILGSVVIALSSVKIFRFVRNLTTCHTI